MSASSRIEAAKAAHVRLFRAPGRVNIIGEHTDYNDGLVLPTNTALYTWLTIRERPDRIITVDARNLDDAGSFSLDAIERSDNPGWIDYVQGVASELQSEGAELRGADITLDGELPIGGGLSSSASLELAVATALLAIAKASLPQTRLARLCQRAERRFAGVNCGIMDQYSIACCERGKAMLLDCRTLETESVAIPEGLALLITDSGVKHKLPDSGYNSRADECAQALQLLAEVDRNVSSLRDVSPELLAKNNGQLGDVLFRRCRHVITENQRVRDAVRALVSGEIEELGKLVSASHASLRDDFEVSCDEVESLVAIADGCDGVLGSRMVGAGFGGCVLSVTRATEASDVIRRIRERYTRVSGAKPWIHTVVPTEPVQEVTAG